MEPGRAGAPELDAIWYDAVPRPEVRPWHRSASKPLLGLRDTTIEFVSGAERLALIGRPRADLTGARTLSKIAIGFVGGHVLDAAVDAHLPVETRPIDAQRRR